MTYSVGGLIQASDFNNLAGDDLVPNTGNTLNAIWGTGFGNAGYGQSPITNVDQNDVITYNNWNEFLNVMNTVAYHQFSPITSYAPPLADDKIEYLSKLIDNKNTLYSNRNYARQQGSTSTSSLSVSNTWYDSAVFTHNIVFESADKARYFFNAGGQIAITLSHTTGVTINQMWHEIAANTGTIVISASTAGTTNNIAGTGYTGITRVGGSGSGTVNVNYGYYLLSQNYVEIFRKNAFSVFSKYLQSYVSMELKSNGTQGINGDRGSILTLRTTWNEVPDGTISNNSTTVNITVRYPYSTSVVTPNYLVPFYNTWGLVTVNGTVIAQ